MLKGNLKLAQRQKNKKPEKLSQNLPNRHLRILIEKKEF